MNMQPISPDERASALIGDVADLERRRRSEDERVALLAVKVEFLGEALASAVEHVQYLQARLAHLERVAHEHAPPGTAGEDAEAGGDDADPAGPSLIPAGPSQTSPE